MRRPPQTWRSAAAHAADGAAALEFNAFKVELLKRTITRQLETSGGRR
ncbi:hypothetical protein MOQ72_20930 [Saccharopolyspora sp. K220]|nr:hypothetical protein [Saccharopolyspora soli]MCI2419915.1 hypothetical protein [Saccharopolyspora soli]